MREFPPPPTSHHELCEQAKTCKFDYQPGDKVVCVYGPNNLYREGQVYTVRGQIGEDLATYEIAGYVFAARFRPANPVYPNPEV